jgi:hypothetical protein
MIECEVPGCHERIAHDFGKVGAHFSRVHPTLGLREYYETYVTKIKVCIHLDNWYGRILWPFSVLNTFLPPIE